MIDKKPHKPCQVVGQIITKIPIEDIQSITITGVVGEFGDENLDMGFALRPRHIFADGSFKAHPETGAETDRISEWIAIARTADGFQAVGLDLVQVRELVVPVND